MKIDQFLPIATSVKEGWTLRGDEDFQFMNFWPLSHTKVAEGVYSTRIGGGSIGPSGSMNLNLYKKFDNESGQANFRLFCKRLGINARAVATTRLIYLTNEVEVINAHVLPDIYNEPAAPHADAIVTNLEGVTLFLYAADCAIIYFVDPVNRAIGLAHSAWRTALGGILDKMLWTMNRNYGTKPKDLVTVIAPCLGAENFEVGENVAERFELEGLGDHILRESGKKPRLDFYGINEELLRRLGVLSENIYATRTFCTMRDEDLFHSFRRGPVNDKGDHLNGLNGAFLSLL